MWYAIISEDVANSLPLRAGSREAHLARLQLLVDEGRLLIAGPHPAIDEEDPSLVVPRSTSLMIPRILGG